MFDYRSFLMRGFKSAIGRMADYKIIFNANGYYEKGVLTEDDLAELESLINEKNSPPEQTDVPADEVTEEEVTEEGVSNE